MKPTREECIEQAVKSAVLNNEYMWLHVAPESLERFALAMYKRGQEDMREKAVAKVEEWFDPCEPWITPNTIRTLPIEGEE